jgi:hypothetical protein
MTMTEKLTPGSMKETAKKKTHTSMAKLFLRNAVRTRIAEISLLNN